MKNIFQSFNFEGHVKIVDLTTGEILLDDYNAIHPQNIARIISRGLANEPNSSFYRLAFGNGGTFLNGGEVVERQVNNGFNDSRGWESRLYNEIYSEVIDSSLPNYGVDEGSSGLDNVRVNGGDYAFRDEPTDGLYSRENGVLSEVIIDMVINDEEPLGDSRTFTFDEVGIYSSGAPALSTSGISSIDIELNKEGLLADGDNIIKTSYSQIVGLVDNPLGDVFVSLPGGTRFSIPVVLNGVRVNSLITTPPAGTGTGVAGAFTYGDLCEGINTGAWLDSASPFDFSGDSGALFFISDTGTALYPSINNLDSRGFFSVQSKSTGSQSTISFPEEETVLGSENLIYFLARHDWLNVNSNIKGGDDRGIVNNSNDSTEERERLLTHIIFPEKSKDSTSRIKITYSITVSAGECISQEIILNDTV